MKRGLSLLLVVFLIFSLGFIFAQENSFAVNDVRVDSGSVNNEIEGDEVLKSINEEYGDIKETDVTFTPDSNFYFIEKIFENFRNDVANMRVKIAEVRELVREGKFEEAKISLERLKNYANEVENNADPEIRNEARQAVAEIIKTIENIKSKIPEEYQKELVDDVLDRSKKIVTAIETNFQIKKLCESLSKSNPLEYSRSLCVKIDDNSQSWMKELNKDLTQEQKDEAINFADIMGECFKTSGKQCKCEDISFVPMSEMCIAARPLAIECSEGDEDSCEKLDNLETPEMPDYLEEVMRNVESRFMEDSYDNHIPVECREAGITGESKGDREKCFEIMVETNAPEECKQALKDSKVTSERDAREICEKIMFEINAPQECIDAGLKNPKECGKYMFKINAPQECVDAGLTGENRNDHKECEKIMRSLENNFNGEGEKEFRGERRGPPGADCMRISNEKERLTCFENTVHGFGDFENKYRQDSKEDFEKRFKITKEKEKMCAESCYAQNAAWDFSNGECRCRSEQNKYNYQKSTNCPAGQHWDSATKIQTPQGSCVPNNCQYGVDPSTGQCDVRRESGNSACAKNTYSCAFSTDCTKVGGYWCPEGTSRYGYCRSISSEDCGVSACGNGKCESGESTGSCPGDCGSSYSGGSCYGKTQSQCTSPCVWYSDSSHLTSRGESSHCDDTAHATSGQPVTSGSGTCSGSPSFSCPTGTLQCINNAWGCSDGNSKSYTEGSQTCPSGSYWNGAKCETQEESCLKGTGCTWSGSYCTCSGSTSGTTGSGTCSSTQTWDGSKCVTMSPGTTTTTTGTTSVSCGPGYHVENGGCVIDSSTSGTTGAVITGKSIFGNPFLEYYFWG